MRKGWARVVTLLLLSGLAGLAPMPAGTVAQSSIPTGPPPTAQTKWVAPPAPAGEPADEDDGGEVVRISSNLIMVPVAVTDEKGRMIPGLTVGDFHLEEEGRAQAVEMADNPELIPIHLALLLDISSSVKRRFSFERKAAARFLQHVMRDVDTATVFTIGDEPRMWQERAGAEQAAAALEDVKASAEFTAFNDTLIEAAGYLVNSTPAHHRRVIVVLSDGIDTCSRRCTVPTEAAAELQRADATLYAINPSGGAMKSLEIIKRGQGHLEMLAAATGGAALYPNELHDLDKSFKKIAAELRSQYLLQYYSKAETPGGSFVAIRVRVPRQPKTRVHARTGYFRSDR